MVHVRLAGPGLAERVERVDVVEPGVGHAGVGRVARLPPVTSTRPSAGGTLRRSRGSRACPCPGRSAASTRLNAAAPVPLPGPTGRRGRACGGPRVRAGSGTRNQSTLPVGSIAALIAKTGMSNSSSSGRPRPAARPRRRAPPRGRDGPPAASAGCAGSAAAGRARRRARRPALRSRRAAASARSRPRPCRALGGCRQAAARAAAASRKTRRDTSPAYQRNRQPAWRGRLSHAHFTSCSPGAPRLAPWTELARVTALRAGARRRSCSPPAARAWRCSDVRVPADRAGGPAAAALAAAAIVRAPARRRAAGFVVLVVVLESRDTGLLPAETVLRAAAGGVNPGSAVRVRASSPSPRSARVVRPLQLPRGLALPLALLALAIVAGAVMGYARARARPTSSSPPASCLPRARPAAGGQPHPQPARRDDRADRRPRAGDPQGGAGPADGGDRARHASTARRSRTTSRSRTG